MLDWAGESQYYVEPKRLARLGYLEPRTEPGRTRPRTVYSLTEQGLDALRAWAATPVTVTPLKSEPLLRLLIADLVGEDVTRAALATLREDLADLDQRLDDSEAAAEALPHRAPYLLLGQPLPAAVRRAPRGARRRGRARAAIGLRAWSCDAIGIVESPLTDAATAPKQGDEGAPEAWIAFAAGVARGARGDRGGRRGARADLARPRRPRRAARAPARRPHAARDGRVRDPLAATGRTRSACTA